MKMFALATSGSAAILAIISQVVHDPVTSGLSGWTATSIISVFIYWVLFHQYPRVEARIDKLIAQNEKQSDQYSNELDAVTRAFICRFEDKK